MMRTVACVYPCSSGLCYCFRREPGCCLSLPVRDTFEAQLFYGDLKAIVKTSHLVKIDYPKFIVHGKKGSFIKYGIDQQETRHQSII